MKRVATVVANDGNTRTKITIEVNNKGRDLTRDEVKHVVDRLTGDVFAAVQKTPYSNYPVTEIKVK
jgi:hypothetical protein